MTRDEFMRELAYLLQDIQEEDKEDAIQYYQDYLDEAGPEQEAEVIRELGSPERISAIIRSDIAGHLENGGEFTESGYQDERFRDPNYQVARRFDLPEKQDEKEREHGRAREGMGYGRKGAWRKNHRTWQKSQGTPQEDRGAWDKGQETPQEDRGAWDKGQGAWDKSQGTWEKNGQRQMPRESDILIKVILWIILIIVAGPILLGLGGGVVGIVCGIGAAILVLLIITGVITVAMVVSGAALIPFGIAQLITNPMDGVFMSGIGMILLGIGVLFLALSVLFYGKFLPFLIRSIVDAINRLIHKRRYRS